MRAIFSIIAFAFIIVMSLFSLLHIVYFLFNRQSYENIYYAVFLLGWAAYIFTFSNLALATDYSMNLLFRTNVSLFFWIFAFFPIPSFIILYFNPLGKLMVSFVTTFTTSASFTVLIFSLLFFEEQANANDKVIIEIAVILINFIIFSFLKECFSILLR